MILDILGAILIFLGVCVMAVATFGIYRFKYVLNRMHAAALGDTLGLLLILLGLMCMYGWAIASAKLFLIIVFMWLASPVMSHLIARAEVMTCQHINEECEVISHDDDRI